MELKERIKKMNILKKYLKYYMDAIPYYSQDKAISLLEDIESELNWFKLQKQIKERNEKGKQLELF